MKIIDGHIHIGRWSELFLNYETKIDEAIEILKRSSIQGAVCIPADNTDNDYLLEETKRRSDFKFYFCAWINPEDINLNDFLDRNVNDIKFLKIHPSICKKKITDRIFVPYIEYARKNKTPVIVHCGRWLEIANYRYPLALAEKYPDLKLILAHLGGDQPSLCIPCAKEIKLKGMNNVYLGTESVREFHFVNEVVRIAGPDRIIFGSDYNLGLPKMYIEIIKSLDISDNAREKIYSGNILSLINE